MWCKSCRVTGYTHCAHPDECGNMVTLTAVADSWKSWLDDAPLPETFNSATGGLQDFITALSRALLTARAELDTTQTQLGNWIVRAPIKSSFEDAGSVEEMMMYTELQSAVHAMIQRLEYSFTFNPTLLTIPKRKQQVAEILEEAEKYIWRIKEEMRCA